MISQYEVHQRLHNAKIPHICEQYPPLVEPFILAGKAKTVFSLIELKARREQELNLMMRRQEIKELRATGKACKFWPGYRCTKPDGVSCAEVDCPAWKEIDGE